MRRQRGLSLIGFLLVGTLVAFGVILGMKVVPAYIEYYTILKNIKAIVKSGETRNATVPDIRRAYDKRATIDYAEAITSADLDITKDNGQVVISFAYSKKIHLIGIASLVLDFEGTTAGSAAE
ncbi:MAG: DUF4845 domain-containing protein [Rhodocyclaceae bacterium]|nr:DUF4845 domain-containing protein [Rhodocyclaceae bacterium]